MDVMPIVPLTFLLDEEVAQKATNGRFADIFEKKIELSPSAMVVLEKRYLKRDFQGKPNETPEEMLTRVAYAIAEAERKYDPNADIDEMASRFYEMMIDRDFMPNSPTLMNAGRHLGQLSACFVLPVDDSMESIFETLKHTALIHKSGGGTGFSFSRLRPQNDVVRSTVGISSGPVSFMKVFDSATETIKQGGTRRGANMGILCVDHPDITEFITAKRDLSMLTNFNISVALTEDFMHAVEEDLEYELLNPRSGTPVKKMRAREVFDLIVECAWASGEPGIIFLDRINRDNPTPHIGEIESTNPCGEQPLLPYESCNLASINLSNFVRKNKIQWDKLRQTVHDGVRFLDNVIDVNKFPLPQIERMTRANRKIGLGIMGFAEMLFKLRVPFNSDNAIRIAEQVMSFIQEEGHKESSRLAEERGIFPNFQGSIYDHPDGEKMRNATVTTIAPTGTISIIAGTSSGIEPLFALAFVRNVLDGEKLVDVNQVFMDELKKRGLFSDKLVNKVIEKGTLHDIPEIPDDMKEIFIVAHDISPEWHIKIQSAFQKFTDNAVSKTINFPNSATKEDIHKGYLMAYRLGCKGMTVYRDGSRSEQVLTMGIKEKKSAEIEKTQKKETERVERIIRKRPAIVHGMTFKIGTGCGNLYVTINEDQYGPFEVFSHLGKTGGCSSSQSEAVSRMISLALRSGLEPDDIVKQIKGLRCPSPMWDRGEMILSCPDGLAKAIQWYSEIRDKRQGVLFPVETSEAELHIEADDTPEPINGTSPMVEIPHMPCPECGGRLILAEGCATCSACGYSKCS